MVEYKTKTYGLRSDVLNFPFRVYIYVMITSGFRRNLDDICALLGYYAVYSERQLPTFKESLSVRSAKVKISKKKLYLTHRLSRTVGNELLQHTA